MAKTAIILLVTLVLAGVFLAGVDLRFSELQLRMLYVLSLEMLGFAGLCFVVSEISGNYSQVDKLWSITPIVFAWTAAAMADFEPRMVLMSVLATVWGVRLTYNFSRHGAYQWKFWQGHEDYRWEHVRKNPMLSGRIRFMLFNLFFISFYQHALLLLITLPIVAVAESGQSLYWADAIFAAAFIGLVVFETIADQQQWDFQNEKHRRIKAGEVLAAPYNQGFVASGLWSRSRHPNYFAEQSIWVVFFLFSIAALSQLNWSGIGCVLLIILFRGSSNLSESISAAKYPAYTDYQKKVPRFLPL